MPPAPIYSWHVSFSIFCNFFQRQFIAGDFCIKLLNSSSISPALNYAIFCLHLCCCFFFLNLLTRTLFSPKWFSFSYLGGHFQVLFRYGILLSSEDLFLLSAVLFWLLADVNSLFSLVFQPRKNQSFSCKNAEIYNINKWQFSGCLFLPL